MAYAAGRALPAMDPALGVLARGTTVVIVMAAGLWIGGSSVPRSCACSSGSGARAAQPRSPLTPAGETTELAGEIVATDLPDDTVVPPATGGPGR